MAESSVTPDSSSTLQSSVFNIPHMNHSPSIKLANMQFEMEKLKLEKWFTKFEIENHFMKLKNLFWSNRKYFWFDYYFSLGRIQIACWLAMIDHLGF
jgi:hypothetical protein